MWGKSSTTYRKFPRSAALIYLLVGAAWIVVSDRVPLPRGISLQAFHTAKGIVFVALTAYGLYFLLHRLAADVLRSEERFISTFEHSPDALVVISIRDRRIVEANATFAKLAQLSREEVIEVPVSELRLFPSDEERAGFLHGLFDEGRAQAFEVNLRTGGSRQLRVLVSRSVVEISGDYCLIASLRDVSEQHEAAQNLRRAEERYRLFVERNLAGAFRASEDGTLLECNAAFAHMLGFDLPEQCIGLPADSLNASPEAGHKLLSEVTRRGAVSSFETQLRRRDGSNALVLLNASLVPGETKGRRVIEGTIVDITEMRKLQEQLRQMQKIEAVGRLAGGVAHDFNNILGVISGYLELLQFSTGLTEKQKRHVEVGLEAVQRGASLTQQLLAFSRKQVTRPEFFNLNSVISSELSLLQRLLGEDIQFVISTDHQLPQIHADRTQVQQVIMNLLLNARDAMPEGGTIRLGTNTVVAPSTELPPYFAPGSYVSLFVADTGIGMDEVTLSHIFEPFFTTKEGGRGTGLGLATVYGVVKQNNGYVDVESAPGKGSTFRVYWPVANSTETQPVEIGPSLPTPQVPGSATLLLVEDEEALRQVTTEYLRDLGYNVLPAPDGQAALELARNNLIDLLITDVVMPGMTGPKLFELLSAREPELRVLYISGYTDQRLTDLQEGGALKHFVQKPFNLNLLAQQIHGMLEIE